MAPSIFADRTTPPVATSTSRAVIRSWSPSRWYPPVTSHRAPRRRPTWRTAPSLTGTAPVKPIALIASEIAPGAMTSTVAASWRSAIRVSAMPTPIQSSPAARLMLSNGITASTSVPWPGGSPTLCAVTVATPKQADDDTTVTAHETQRDRGTPLPKIRDFILAERRRWWKDRG